MADRNDDSSARRQEEDRIALESGDLPQSVKDRLLSQTSSGTRLFSSTLSVKEYLSTRSTGVLPLGQVMGTAFITMPQDKKALQQYVGRQNPGLISSITATSLRGLTTSGGYGQPVCGELDDLTYGRLEARRLAITRMAQEAQMLGASGIIAVRTQKRFHDWGGRRTLEFTVMGTAIRVPEMNRSAPFTSLLTGQEFCQLWNAGFEPMGIALGACTYTDCTDTTSIYQRNYNQEVVAYTNCFYEARKQAMTAFMHDLRKLRAAGAVGMEIDYEFEDAESEVEVSEGVEVKFLHLITHFAVMGTAIARRPGFVNQPKPRPTVVYDLRKAGAAEVDFAQKGPMK